VEWHGGSQNIFFERPIGTDTNEIYGLNLATGVSKLWSHFTPTDKTAMLALRHAIVSPDGAHVPYVVQRIFSPLFVAKNIH
jgi:hypothetical protein